MNLLHFEVKKAMVVNNDITMFLSDKSCPFLHSYYDEIWRRNYTCKEALLRLPQAKQRQLV